MSANGLSTTVVPTDAQPTLRRVPDVVLPNREPSMNTTDRTSANPTAHGRLLRRAVPAPCSMAVLNTGTAAPCDRMGG